MHKKNGVIVLGSHQYGFTWLKNISVTIYRPHLCALVTDWTFGLAELLLFSLAQMTEPFSAEHRTFLLGFSKWLP